MGTSLAGERAADPKDGRRALLHRYQLAGCERKSYAFVPVPPSSAAACEWPVVSFASDAKGSDGANADTGRRLVGRGDGGGG